MTPFKTYITHNQIHTDYYYNATPGAAQRDIKTSLAMYDALLDLEKAHKSQTPEEFAKTYKAAVARVQAGFGDTGFGPVASLSTESADLNRGDYIASASEG